MVFGESCPGGDDDSRLYRIINEAKFEIDEIQRRHRQNETDADNLDKEMEKLRLEGERIEREVGHLRDQTAQYAGEYDRATSVAEAAETEKKGLEEKLKMKRAALDEFDRKVEREKREHEDLMQTWREKFDRSNQAWEKVPYIRELREWEKKRDEDERKVTEFRREKAPTFARMARKKSDEARIEKEFDGSTTKLWVHLAERAMAYRRDRAEVDRRRGELVRLKAEGSRLQREVERARESEAEEISREALLKRPEVANKDVRSRTTTTTNNASGGGRSGGGGGACGKSATQKNRCDNRANNGSKRATKKHKVKPHHSTTTTTTTSSPTSTSTSFLVPQFPSAGCGRSDVGSPPGRKMSAGFAAHKGSTMLATPQLNIPSFLRIGRGAGEENVGAQAPPSAESSEAAASSRLLSASVALASSFEAPSFEAPSFEASSYEAEEFRATTEEAQFPAAAQPDGYDSFDLSLDRPQNESLGDLSFNMDFGQGQNGNRFVGDGDPEMSFDF